MTAPAVVDKVLSAVNGGDTDALIALFSADGEVDDWGAIYRGKNDIRTWSDRELIGAKARFTLKTADQHGNIATMLVQVGGNGFIGPSRFTFTLVDGLIRRMQITAKWYLKLRNEGNRRHVAWPRQHSCIIEAAIVIARPVGAVFSFYRDFRNLPLFLGDVLRVEVENDIAPRWISDVEGRRL
jgi:SnoaL-like protein